MRRRGNLRVGIFCASNNLSLGNCMVEEYLSFMSSIKSCNRFSREIGDPIRMPSSAIFNISEISPFLLERINAKRYDE